MIYRDRDFPTRNGTDAGARIKREHSERSATTSEPVSECNRSRAIQHEAAQHEEEEEKKILNVKFTLLNFTCAFAIFFCVHTYANYGTFHTQCAIEIFTPA